MHSVAPFGSALFSWLQSPLPSFIFVTSALRMNGLWQCFRDPSLLTLLHRNRTQQNPEWLNASGTVCLLLLHLDQKCVLGLSSWSPLKPSSSPQQSSNRLLDAFDTLPLGLCLPQFLFRLCLLSVHSVQFTGFPNPWEVDHTCPPLPACIPLLPTAGLPTMCLRHPHTPALPAKVQSQDFWLGL